MFEDIGKFLTFNFQQKTCKDFFENHLDQDEDIEIFRSEDFKNIRLNLNQEITNIQSEEENQNSSINSISDNNNNSNIFIGQKREENNLTEAEKKEERRKKNRESAKRSRDKKKVEINNLFEENKLLNKQIDFFKKFIEKKMCETCKHKIIKELGKKKNTNINISLEENTPIQNLKQKNYKKLPLLTTIIVIICLFRSGFNENFQKISPTISNGVEKISRNLQEYKKNLNFEFTFPQTDEIIMNVLDYYNINYQTIKLLQENYKKNNPNVKFIDEDKAYEKFLKDKECKNCMVGLSKNIKFINSTNPTIFKFFLTKNNMIDYLLDDNLKKLKDDAPIELICNIIKIDSIENK